MRCWLPGPAEFAVSKTAWLRVIATSASWGLAGWLNRAISSYFISLYAFLAEFGVPRLFCSNCQPSAPDTHTRGRHVELSSRNFPSQTPLFAKSEHTFKMVKAREIRAETREQLMSRLAELRKELASLRVAQLTNGAPSRIAKIGSTRKDIARVLTVFHSNERLQAKKLLADKPLNQWPKDLRPKKTRALRRALPKALVSARGAFAVHHGSDYSMFNTIFRLISLMLHNTRLTRLLSPPRCVIVVHKCQTALYFAGQQADLEGCQEVRQLCSPQVCRQVRLSARTSSNPGSSCWHAPAAAASRRIERRWVVLGHRWMALYL